MRIWQNNGIIMQIKTFQKIVILVAGLLILSGGVYYGYSQSWFGDKVEVGEELQVPRKPSDANDELKVMYATAVVSHEARMKDSSFVNYLREGLDWKTVGEFARKDEQRAYFVYSAYVYTKAADQYPDKQVALVNAGNIFVQLGEFGRAEQAYKKAAEIDPKYADPLLALLEAMQTLKAPPSKELLSYFRERYPKLEHDGGQFVYMYARYLLTVGENAEALDVLKTGAGLFKDDKRLPVEYAEVKKELEKRGYKEPVKIQVQ